MATRVRRSAGVPSRLLLAAGSVTLAGTIGLLALEMIRHFAGVHGPVLPTSWCREVSMAPLTPLAGLRWVTAWQPDWIAIAVLAAVAALYLAGVAAVRRRHRQPWSRRRTASFLAGLVVCVTATSGPIATYDMALFSAHMLGHLALVMVAPPLLVLGRPMTLTLHATRNPWHTRVKRLVRSPVAGFWFCPPVALATYATVIVGTHLTGLMDQIMSRPWAGQLEHAIYLTVGYQLFSLVLGDEPLRWRLSMPAKQLLLAVAMAVDTFTGVILLQSTTAISMVGMSPSHVDPLTETHLGGAIMWVGGDAIMALVMIVVGIAWWRQPEHRRRDRSSWIEQARRDRLASLGLPADALTATERISEDTSGSVVRDVDTDGRAHEQYNAWLAHLARNESGAPK